MALFLKKSHFFNQSITLIIHLIIVSYHFAPQKKKKNCGL
jgi:hypothetical protein